jgi:hypothetical protein
VVVSVDELRHALVGFVREALADGFLPDRTMAERVGMIRVRIILRHPFFGAAMNHPEMSQMIEQMITEIDREEAS